MPAKAIAMKKIIINLLALLVSFCLSIGSIAAPIYRAVNDDGSVTFSDQEPLDGYADEVELGKTIIHPAVTVPANPLITASEAENLSSSKKVRIHAPADESVVHGTDNRLTVSVSVSPAIGEREQLQLLHNGSAYGPPQSSGQWNLARINPGTQKFSVRFQDSSGQRISESDTITIYFIP